MSNAEHDDHEGEHEAHDDHHAEPVLPEPETPVWLTLLGIGIFVLGGLALLFRAGSQDAANAAAAASASAAAGASAPIAKAAPPPQPAQPAPQPVMPTPLRPRKDLASG